MSRKRRNTRRDYDTLSGTWRDTGVYYTKVGSCTADDPKRWITQEEINKAHTRAEFFWKGLVRLSPIVLSGFFVNQLWKDTPLTEALMKTFIISSGYFFISFFVCFCIADTSPRHLPPIQDR